MTPRDAKLVVEGHIALGIFSIPYQSTGVHYVQGRCIVGFIVTIEVDNGLLFVRGPSSLGKYPLLMLK